MNAAHVPAPAEAGFDPGWLALREPADHDARAGSLVELLVAHLGPVAPGREVVVRDLGSGTGSMARWLAPRLPGPQRWVLDDRDPALLARAARDTAELRDAGGGPVAVDTRETDVTALRAADLAGASVVTASALLDLLTADELDALAAACAAAGCPALLTLSVAGGAELHPPDGADPGIHADIAAAFDAHQRRTSAGRALLGPDAPDVAARAFRRHGMVVHEAASPWRLGSRHRDLLDAWLRGWVAAAVEQRPDLDARAASYLRRRLAPDHLPTAVVHHRDLLAVPPGVPS